MKTSNAAELSDRAVIIAFKEAITTVQGPGFKQSRQKDCKMWAQDNRKKTSTNNECNI